MKVDGVPVEEYSLAHLRDAVAMVLQKNTLFAGSLRENLLWGNPEASDEELLRACRIARVDEFLDRLENGLDTEMLFVFLHAERERWKSIQPQQQSQRIRIR